MAHKLIKRHLLLADIETAYGAGAALDLDGGDAILIENFTHNPVEQSTVLERGGLTGSLSMPKTVFVGRLAGFSFDTEFKTSGAAGTPPEYGRLLKACGLEETEVTDTSVTYATDIHAIASDEIVLWDGGADVHQLLGARGNLGVNLEAGTYAKLNFAMTGHPVAPVALARVTPVYDGKPPIPLKNVTMTIDAFGTWEIYSAVLAMNATVSAPEVMTGVLTTGYASVEITEWSPELVVTMTADDIADGYDPFSDMEASLDRVITISPPGSAGNIITINAPMAIITAISTGDVEGRLTYEVTYQLAESLLGASDNFNLVLT